MTTAAPAGGRVRRSIRFAQLAENAQAPARESTPRRERFSGTEKLEMAAFQNTQDWARGMGISPSGRFQVPSEPQAKQKIFSREGVRKDFARVILWMMLAAVVATALAGFGALASSTLRINRLENRINAADARGQTLRTDLARQSGDISVCTKAVELNLISSNGAATIQLTAPDANMTLVYSQNSTATQEPELRAGQNIRGE